MHTRRGNLRREYGPEFSSSLIAVPLRNASVIHLTSLADHLDTSLAAGDRTLHIFGAIANLEAGLISERTRDSIAALVERMNIMRAKTEACFARPSKELVQRDK